MIQLEQIEKLYRTGNVETLALSGLNLTVEQGESLTVMGPSGSGKSTLLNLIGLLDTPSRGQIRIAGSDVLLMSDRELSRFRNEHIGFIFQSFHLIRDLTVQDNVEIPLLYRSLSSGARRRLCMEALECVGLGSQAHQRPGQLSGGQQQRVAIARAVVGKPRILLADEPTGNLDSQMGADVMAILGGLNQEEGTTLILVTHDMSLAEQTGRILRLFDGRQVR